MYYAMCKILYLVKIIVLLRTQLNRAAKLHNITHVWNFCVVNKIERTFLADPFDKVNTTILRVCKTFSKISYLCTDTTTGEVNVLL